MRISYTGTCKDPGLTVKATPKMLHREPVAWFQAKPGRLILSDDGSGLIGKGDHTIRIMDVHGKVLHTFEGRGARSYEMPGLAAGQVYVLRAETPIGIAQRTFSPL